MAGQVFFHGPWRVAVDATVMESLVLQIIFQGINGFFKEKEDIFLLMSQIFQDLIIILKIQ